MPPQSSAKNQNVAVDSKNLSTETPNGVESIEPHLPEDQVQVDDKIYDVHSIANDHPGGKLFVQMFAGRDATEAFLSYHRRTFPHEKMSKALIEQTKAAKDKNADADYLELCKLVEQVLPRGKAFAPLSYYFKVAALLVAAVSLEIYIHTTKSYKWYYTAVLGWLFALIGLNIQHDANHGAISRYSAVNRILGLTQNYIGGSAIDWIHQHVVQHHINPNNVDMDPDIIGNVILRLNPLKPILFMQSFQHLYIFMLLALFGATFIFFSLKHNIDGFHFTNYSALIRKNYHRVFEEFSILFFAFRWFVLPQLLQPSLYTFLNCLPLVIVGGYYLSFFFLISHNFEGVRQFDSAYNKVDDQSFLVKQVTTASNVGGSWLCFLNGGLNYQIEHHLFPRISHCHYPLIAPIVREYCEKKKIPYVHFPTVTDNLLSCLRHLYQMGHRPFPPGYVQHLQANSN